MKTDMKITKKSNQFLVLSALILMLVFAGAVGTVLANEGLLTNEGPETVLKQCVNKTISILNDPVYKNASEKELLHKVLFNECEPTFDFRALSMGVLGRNWRRFSKKEQNEFIKYFSHLIAQIYFEKLDRKSIKDVSIRYIKTTMLPPTRSGIKRADVTSEVTHNGIKTPVIYRMLKRKHGKWKIYDLKIEGVSLVLNYREQYRNKFMETPEQIIEELKKKVNM